MEMMNGPVLIFVFIFLAFVVCDYMFPSGHDRPR